MGRTVTLDALFKRADGSRLDPKTVADNCHVLDEISAVFIAAWTIAQGVVAINIAAVIFGTAALYGKLNVSPFWIVAMRAGFGAFTLGLIGGHLSSLRGILTSSWRIIGLSGTLLTAHWLTFFMSVQLAGVAVATLTFATFPLFTVIVEAAQQRRFPTLADSCWGRHHRRG